MSRPSPNSRLVVSQIRSLPCRCVLPRPPVYLPVLPRASILVGTDSLIFGMLHRGGMLHRVERRGELRLLRRGVTVAHCFAGAFAGARHFGGRVNYFFCLGPTDCSASILSRATKAELAGQRRRANREPRVCHRMVKGSRAACRRGSQVVFVLISPVTVADKFNLEFPISRIGASSRRRSYVRSDWCDELFCPQKKSGVPEWNAAS